MVAGAGAGAGGAQHLALRALFRELGAAPPECRSFLWALVVVEFCELTSGTLGACTAATLAEPPAAIPS